MAMNDFLKMLNRLEDFVEDGFRTPLFGKFILDETQFFELCNKLRASVDPAIKQAALTNREAEKIIEEATSRAKQVIDKAQDDAKVILKKAHEEAERRQQTQDGAKEFFQKKDTWSLR